MVVTASSVVGIAVNSPAARVPALVGVVGAVANTIAGAFGRRTRATVAVIAATAAAVVPASETAAVAQALAAAAATAANAGAAGLTTGLALGPVGWLTVGASEEPTTSAYTFDCWKQVVHDTSSEPSSGRLLREIVVDPRVKQVTTSDDNSTFPEIILENIWNEKFRIEYVQLLPTDQWAAHAVLMS